MLNTLTRLSALLITILRTGRFRASGVDINKRRMEMLKGLEAFAPGLPRSNGRKTSYWRGQLAFLGSALRGEGRHLLIPEKALAYVRIPRAASTVLSHAMLCAMYPELNSHLLSPVQVNFLADVNLAKRVAAAPASPVTFFAVVRNPFARVVSVYREFFERRSEPFLYDTYLFGILRHDFSFEEFVHALGRIPDTLKDQHVRPQHSLLSYYRKKKIPVTVLTLETPALIRAFLAPYDLSMPALNRPEPTDYRDYYTPRILEDVYRLYARDVSAFGYTSLYHELKNFVSARS